MEPVTQVKFWQPGKNYLRHKAEINAAMQRVLESGELVMGFGKDTEIFEQRFAEYIGTRFAIMVGSGTQALYLAYKALGIGQGDEVITVSHTFIATIDQIVAVGAKPVLVDIGDDGLMDAGALNRAITPNTKAIVPVHLEGKVCDMEMINFIASGKGLLVIEDAAQAVGASFEDSKAGSMGHAGCFSFYPAKVLGCYGNAGMVTTNDPVTAHRVRMLRCNYNIGKNPDVDGAIYGTNMEGDNIQAAVLNVKLDYLPVYLERRKGIAKMYDEELVHTPLILPYQQAGRIYQDYVIRTKSSLETIKLNRYLQDRGVGTLGCGLIPNHFYSRLNLNFDLPRTVGYLARQIRIPCNPELTDEEVKYVISVIKEFYGA